MILVVFATPPENPFDVRLEKGVVTPFEGLWLLLAGIGVRAGERLEEALSAHPEVTGVLEFGGAAAVSGAEVGTHYAIARVFSTGGVPTGALAPVPGLPRAAAVCAEEIYRGGGFPWSAAAGLPLLYTMETGLLRDVCQRRDLPFRSIRIATDDGRGDIRGRYQAVLGTARNETANLIGEAVLHFAPGQIG